MYNEKLIKVNFDTINYQPVIDKFNEIKTNDILEISKLDRFEGGFSIPLKSFNDNQDSNYKIKQLRWSKKKLITPISYIPFDEIEIEYLYHALKEVYGDDKVQLIYKDENYTPAVVRVPTKSHEDDGGYIAVPEDIIK
jgi:hypothetical protein